MKHLYSLVLLLLALTSSHLVSAQIVPNVTYTNDNTFSCSGTATAAPSGGAGSYTYLWSTGATTSSISNLCAGNYYVIIADASQDSVSFNFTVTNPCSNLTLSAAATNCTPGNCDGTIQLTVAGGSGPYTYSVSGSPQTGMSFLSDLCAGPYTITVVDMNGCSATATATVTDPSASTPIIPNISSTNDLTGNCSGSATVAPSGGSGVYSYQWSSGQTTASISNLCAGTYSVLITDSNQDTITASCVITNPCSNFAGYITSTSTSGPGSCDGTIVINVFNGTAPYTYVWSTGNNTPANFNLCAGTYSVFCTDANGCQITVTGTVSDSSFAPPTISANLTTTDDYSNNCSGIASVAPTGGISPYAVFWSTGETGYTIDSLCAGIYTVYITDATNVDTTVVNFVIADSSTTYGNNPFPNATVNDTLYTDLVTNCMIDYSVIDSASLYQAVYDSIHQNLYVTWAIYSPTDTVYISDTLGLAGLPPGYYGLTISVYCPNKSGNDFFKINSVIYFDGTQVWTSTLGIDEQQLLYNVSVYPNPFTNIIKIDNQNGGVRSMKLVDLNGRVLSEKSNLSSGLVELNQLDALASGTYLLILSGANTSKTYKVIK